MSKRIFSIIGLAVLVLLLTSVLTAAGPTPNPTFTLVQGLPAVMNVGETYTVIVQVDSDVPFNSVQAMPDFYYPGRGVVSVKGGGDRASQGTSATLELTFKAKGSTAAMQELPEHQGRAPVSIVVGVRYGGGYVVGQQYDFLVQVP